MEVEEPGSAGGDSGGGSGEGVDQSPAGSSSDVAGASLPVPIDPAWQNVIDMITGMCLTPGSDAQLLGSLTTPSDQLSNIRDASTPSSATAPIAIGRSASSVETDAAGAVGYLVDDITRFSESDEFGLRAASPA